MFHMAKPRARRLGAWLAAAALVTGGALLTTTPAQADAKPGRYIVSTWTAGGADGAVAKVTRKGVRPSHRFSRVLHGFAATLSSAQLSALRNDSRVRSIVPDEVISIDSTQNDAEWALDRVDQRSDNLDNTYRYQTTGAGVTVFEIDTGIRTTHTQFGGRAVKGYNFVEDNADASDCNGHGTHVAGSIAGSTYGVAKQARLVAVRVLDCNGEGYLSDFIAGLQYVVDHQPAGPAVVNISAGGASNSALDEAVRTVVDEGIPVVVAAGNDDENACFNSPARVSSALTVAATDADDERAYFSDWGSCVDLFAPGVGIRSASDRSDTATESMSGTSMAAPHVAGAVARYLQAYPQASPSAVRRALVGDATSNAVSEAASGSPNKLLYLRSTTTGVPTSVSTTHSDAARTLTLKWSPPYGFGAPAVTGYRITRSGTDTSGRSFTTTNLTGAARSYTFGQLRHGTTYTVTVRSLNASGGGTVSSTTVKMLAAPGKGRVSTPAAGSTNDTASSVTAKWKAPSSGGKVASYAIEVRRTGTTTTTKATASSSKRSLKITKLTKNASFVVRVRAVNAAGQGTWSSWSSKAKAR